MGFLGDAVKTSNQQLESLLELQATIFSQRGVVAKAKELTSSSAIESARSTLAELNESLSEQRSKLEDVERDIKRVESDVEMAEKRLVRDAERLNQSSNPKDIAGIESEISSLKSRLSDLEDAELELLERRDSSRSELELLEQQRDAAEAALDATKSDISSELHAMRAENADLVAKIQGLKGSLPSELVELFDKKLQRGAAVGLLLGSSCSACNMSLNSTAMAEINRVPEDELAFCSECSAILVRG